MFEIPYQIVLGVHIVAFMFNITLVVISDFLGLLWLLGKIKVLPAKIMNWLHRLIWTGLTVSILSGVYLFSTVSEYLLTVPAFYTKVFLVLALVINSFFIGKHLHAATSQPFSEVEKKERVSFFVSGAVSTIGWIGVWISAGLLGL